MKWQWYAGPNEEIYPEGPFDSEAEAIQVGADSYGPYFYVIEAQIEPVKLSNYLIDLPEMLGRAEDEAADLLHPESGVEVLFEIPAGTMRELETLLQQTVDQFQEEKGLVFTPTVFSYVRNERAISLPEGMV